MRCPNCEELLKDDAKVCFSCGQDMKEHAVDSLIQDMIDEDNKSYKKKSNDKVIPSEVTKVKDKPVYGQAFRITSVITILCILVSLSTFLLDWFALSGRGSYLGFVDNKANDYKSKEITSLSLEQIILFDETVVLLEFSPKELMKYSKSNELMYKETEDINGMIKKHWTVIIQQIYIKSLILIPLMGLLSIIMLLIDRRYLAIEFVRGFSLISMLIILLNYLVLRVPFFSMFAIRAKSLLQVENTLNRVTMNLNGINVNNEFYPYKLVEQTGFFVAIVACFIWFILTTVLVEMKKEKNKIYGE